RFMTRLFSRIAQPAAAAGLGWRLAAPALLAVLFVSSGLLAPASRAQSNQILPVSQVREGMQGYAYTIFAGDQIEKFDLEVIGVMTNFLRALQSIVFLQF